MDIFDLDYNFEIVEFGDIATYEKTTRINYPAFVINNSTDTTLKVFLKSPDEKRILLLTELDPGEGYANGNGDAIRHTIPKGTTIYFDDGGISPTQGKVKITLTQ